MTNDDAIERLLAIVHSDGEPEEDEDVEPDLPDMNALLRDYWRAEVAHLEDQVGRLTRMNHPAIAVAKKRLRNAREALRTLA